MKSPETAMLRLSNCNRALRTCHFDFKHIVLAFWAVFVLCGPDSNWVAADDTPVRRWNAAVFIKSLTTGGENAEVSAGSGVLLEMDGTKYLITARHVADKTNAKTIVYVTVGERTQQFGLSELGYARNNSWQVRPQYDAAVLRLADGKLEGADIVAGEECFVESVPVKANLEIVGFPFGIGVTGAAPLAPLVIVGNVASREIDSPLPSPSTKDKERVVLFTPPVASGTSGGPVFAEINPGRWRLVGIYSGYLNDGTSPKLSKLVPIEPIISIVEKLSK